ncbi:MazG family protein [Cellulomonas sp.]|uniref:MazG family protein n=1 Tax=Cellulomonas sp. TaxID=40001 RepID=UPI002D6293B1|nr:MazG family protein [Cellulomonas sp.]HYQ76786.1 MazG family protein [Cellulomonas sp.]
MTAADGATAADPAAVDPAAVDPATVADPLRRLVAVMDRLRSPGGCPWDAEQTHASLVPYVLEEAYEVAEAVEGGDRAHLREELGDLLLQVVFHARIAQEDAAEPFDVDDVAADLVAKLVRRHPHVFADAQVADADGVNRQWDAIKRDEKQRESVLDGVPLAMGALARAQKVASRAERSGLAAVAPAPAVPPAGPPDPGAPAPGPAAPGDLGARLLALVQEARAAGLDAEGELRRATAAWERDLRAAERG